MNSRKPKQFHQYSKENLCLAVQAVKNGENLRKTCRQYGVPKSTVQDRVKGKVTDTNMRMGPEPILKVENEQTIVKWLSELAQCGFPVKKQELLDTVQKIVKKENLLTPFKDGRPGERWYSSFLKRYPEICLKSAEPLEKYRAKITEEFVRSWFRNLRTFLEESKATDILDDPTRIFNGDESGFSLCPKTGKVLGLKGQNLYVVQKGKEKENITVLVTFNADGKLCPTVVVFPYVKPPKAVVESMPSDWILGKSESGWMRSEVFFEYVANGLNTWIEKQNIKRPILLLIDGHKSHMSMDLSIFCHEHQIILYALPPNCTHLLQPADVSVFKSLKEYWRQAVREWQSREENANKVVTKVEFCPIFKSVLQHPNIEKNIKNGFKACGLYPFNPDAVDYLKCVQNNLESVNNISKDSKSITSIDIHEINAAEKIITHLTPKLVESGVNSQLVIDLIKSLQPTDAPEENGAISAPNFTEYVITDDGFLTSITEKHDDPLPHSVTKEEPSVVVILENKILKPPSKIIDNFSVKGPVLADVIQLEDNHTELQKQFKPTITSEKMMNFQAEDKNFKSNKIISEEIQPLENIGPLNTTNIFQEIENHSKIAALGESSDMKMGINLIQKNEINCDCQYEKNLLATGFEKHLVYPAPIQKSSKVIRQALPSAISSEAWRTYYKNKEKEKELKTTKKRRRPDTTAKKETSKVTIKKILKTVEENVQSKNQECGVCCEEMNSDTDEENNKNVGCDECPRWFHLGCTKYIGLKYADVAKKDFICDYCNNN